MEPTSFHIRHEEPEDTSPISDLIKVAFQGMPYAEGDEAELVDTLRRLGALSVSLVAEAGGRVVGHVALSPAKAIDGTAGWYGLGPIAVLPQHQGTGIGTQLLWGALAEIERAGAAGCILVGHPQLYLRAGFVHAPHNAPPGEPPEFFMTRRFRGMEPKGPIYFHPAFANAA